MYFFIALVGFVLLGVSGLLDKVILNKKAAGPFSYAFYISAPFLLLVFLLPFNKVWPGTLQEWIIACGAGVFFFTGLCLMFYGLQNSEVSHIGPLVGVSVSVFTILLSRLFFGEVLPLQKLFAVALLVAGSLIVAFENSQQHHGFHMGMIWGAVAGLFFSLSHVFSKCAYEMIGFIGGLSITRVAIGATALFVLLIPNIRRQVFSHGKTKQQHNKKHIVFLNMAIAAVAVLLVQYAISLGSVSIVSSLEGVKYATLIVLAAVFSRFYPKIFKEKYTKLELIQEISAIIVISIGLFLLI
jgi:drug/metabolite transporter (DMT)-like permease